MTAHQYDPGDILLATYPFTDHTFSKIRPVLVVSQRCFNNSGDFVVVPLSSRIRQNDQFGYVIKDTDSFFGQTHLKMSSTIKWTKPMTISSNVINSKLGTLPQGPLDNVVDLIIKLFKAEPKVKAAGEPSPKT